MENSKNLNLLRKVKKKQEEMGRKIEEINK